MNEPEQLRRWVDEVLLALARNFIGPPSVAILLIETKKRATAAQATFNVDAVVEYIWHLARVGIIAFPGNIEPLNRDGGSTRMLLAQNIEVQSLIITQRGLTFLQKAEESPHHRSRYIQSIRARVSHPDPIVMTYIDEGVGAWEAGLYRCCAVMTGCACERLMLLLAESVSKAPLPPWSDRISKFGKKGPVGISEVFTESRDALQAAADDQKIPGDLADALDRKLSSIFDHVRILRNKSGHPTGEQVSAEEAESGLLMFPGFYAYTASLISAVGSLT